MSSVSCLELFDFSLLMLFNLIYLLAYISFIQEILLAFFFNLWLLISSTPVKWLHTNLCFFPDLFVFFFSPSSDSIDRYPISIEIATPLWNDNDAWTDQISYVFHMSVRWKIGHPMRKEFKVPKTNGNDVKWLRFLIILISIVGAVYKTSFDFFLFFFF